MWDGNNIAVAVENKLVGTMSMGRIIQRVYGRENPKIRVWEGGSKVVCVEGEIQRCVYEKGNPKRRLWEGGYKDACMGRET